MSVRVNVRMSKNHAYANKSRRTYVRDVRQLSNPASIGNFKFTQHFRNIIVKI